MRHKGKLFLATLLSVILAALLFWGVAGEALAGGSANRGEVAKCSVYTGTEKNGEQFILVPQNVPVGSSIILSLYSGTMLTEAQRRIYRGETEIAVTPRTDAENTLAKVFIWSGASGMMPLAEVCSLPLVETYRITYMLDVDTELQSQKKYGEIPAMMEAASSAKEGCILKGWSNSPTGEAQYAAGAIYRENADITLYAVWEKRLYRFGVLSDIHLKDTAFGENAEKKKDVADSLRDYERALTFYKNRDVDFACINGDIVASSWTRETAVEGNAPGEWLSELQIFKDYTDTYLPGVPVYATTGNHDANIFGYSHAENGMGQIVNAYGDGTKTAEAVWEEIVGAPLRFSFTEGDDVFLFVPMYYWHYAQLFRGSDLAWLTEKLEENKEKRVFLFFHLPLGGTYDVDGDGMSQTSGAYKMPLMRDLISRYPNVIWFTGHSHYDLWREGGVRPDGITPYIHPNLYQTGISMTMVHCPSCAYIRKENRGGTFYREYAASQGLLVDVFADRVVIQGIDFTKGNGGALIPPATYVIYKG